jgi:hypothetical protein
MLLTQPYSEAILQPGQTPGSAAGGASPDGNRGVAGPQSQAPGSVTKNGEAA